MKVSIKIKCTQKWHWELGYVTNGEMRLQGEKDELTVDRRTFGSLKDKNASEVEVWLRRCPKVDCISNLSINPPKGKEKPLF